MFRLFMFSCWAATWHFAWKHCVRCCTVRDATKHVAWVTVFKWHAPTHIFQTKCVRYYMVFDRTYC